MKIYEKMIENRDDEIKSLLKQLQVEVKEKEEFKSEVIILRNKDKFKGKKTFKVKLKSIVETMEPSETLTCEPCHFSEEKTDKIFDVYCFRTSINQWDGARYTFVNTDFENIDFNEFNNTCGSRTITYLEVDNRIIINLNLIDGLKG